MKRPEAQISAFTTKNLPVVETSHSESTPLTASASNEIFGIDISTNVQFRGHLEVKVKLVSQNLGVRNRAKQFFMSATVWNSHYQQISRLGITRSSVLFYIFWQVLRNTSNYLLTACSIEQIVGDRASFVRLDPLALRRNVGLLWIFYTFYHGECFE